MNASECVGFNVAFDTKQVISETSVSRQSIALVLTTNSKETNTTYTIDTKEKQK